MIVDVVISTKNEGLRLKEALERLPHELIRSVVVVDGASKDSSTTIARDWGAVLLVEPDGGHGKRCQKAMEHLQMLPAKPDVVILLQPSMVSKTSEVSVLLSVMEEGDYELVLAVPEEYKPDIKEKMATQIVKNIYGQNYPHLNGMKAIRYPALVALGLSDQSMGWNAELLVKATRLELKIKEVPTKRDRGRERKPRWTSVGRSFYQILKHSTRR